MSTAENSTPVALVIEKDGNLAGKRMLTDDFEEASERAEQIDGRIFALEPVEADAPFPPVTVHQVRDLFGITDPGPEAA